MIRWRKRIRKLTLVFMDMLSVITAYVATETLYNGVLSKHMQLSGLETMGMLSVLMLSYVGVFIAIGLYEDTLETGTLMNVRLLVKTVLGFVLSTGITGSMLYFMNVRANRGFILIYAIVLYGLYALSKLAILHLYRAGMLQDKTDRNILIVGCTKKGRRYINEILRHQYLSFNIVGYVEVNDDEGYDGLQRLGSIEDLNSIARECRIDEIAVARPLNYDPMLKEMLDICQDMGITITMLLETKNTENAKAHVAMVGNVPVLKFHTVSLNESQLFAKRILDVCGALVGMVLFGIAFVIVGPIIKMETPGPVIFKQKRVGKNGRVFEIWKFRSMGVNAEAQKSALMAGNEMSGHMFKLSNDPRVTKIGAFIRKTSIDELPQFYNVLRGDMSLVGTRPPTVNEVSHYERHHHRRISITPGITGMWQISGRSDITDFEEVVRLDSEYITNWTIWADIKILIKTVLVVICRKGSK